jgi:outer membrane receptor protein involved in Fe transport
VVVALSFLVLSAFVSVTTVDVRDTSGSAVAWAWVTTCDSVQVATTDVSGTASIPDGLEGDTLRIGRIGFETWTGVPSGPRCPVYLRSVPVPSGVVIPVTAQRAEGPRTPSAVHLESDVLERVSAEGLRSLQGISAGLSVREYGGALPVTSVSVRGADPTQVSWFVNGHRIDSPRDGSPAVFPDPALFGGMEVSRGGSSSTQGGGLAGSVAYVSEDAGMPSVAAAGADDRGGITTLGRFSLGDNRIGISIRRTRGEGESRGAIVSGLVTSCAGPVGYGLLGSWSEGDTEDPDWAAPSGGHRTQTALDAWLSIEHGDFTHTAGGGFGRMGYTAGSPYDIDDVHRDGRVDIGTAWSAERGFLSLETEGRLTGEWVESTSIGSRRRTALMLSADVRLPAGPAVLEAAALGEVEGETLYPGCRISAGVPLAGSLLRSHVSAARSFHLPDFNDLFWPADAFAEGNPMLEPETSWEAEAGFSSSVPGIFDTALTAFCAVTDDMIMWLPGEGGVWSPGNISRARRAGLEISTHWEAGPRSLSGTFTWLDATDMTEGSVNYGMRLPYRPEYTWGAGAAIRVTEWLSAGLSAFGSGLRFTNASQTAALPAYTVLSGTVSAGLPRLTGTRLEVYVTNALDERYEETDGYPGQPRTFGIRIRWTEREP